MSPPAGGASARAPAVAVTSAGPLARSSDDVGTAAPRLGSRSISAPFGDVNMRPFPPAGCGPPPVNMNKSPQARADDEERNRRGHGPERVERWGRHIEGHAPDLERQRV